MTFVHPFVVRFGHVDAAGIVFYPRYFEMIVAAVEEWFEASTGTSFAEVHLGRGLGLPTARLDCTFAAPSRLGETLGIEVSIERLGRSSCALRYGIACEGQERVRASATLVCIDLADGRPVPWPDDLRAGLEAQLPGVAATGETPGDGAHELF